MDAEDLTSRLVGGPRVYTLDELADRAGVSVEVAVRLAQALGLSADRGQVMFSEADVEDLRLAFSLPDNGLGVTYQLPLALALGQSMARMADWQAGLLRDIAVSSTPPGSEEMRNEVAKIALALLPDWERLQRHVWRHHMHLALERIMSDGENPPNDDPIVVGFADIVGFSSISSGLTPERMTKFVEEFTESCSFIVVRGGGCVIKSAGDEIMFTVDDPCRAADIGIALSRLPSTLDARPSLHVGMAYGCVVRHLGDIYGRVVNLASRLTDLARPGTVLVDEQLAARIRAIARHDVRQLSAVSVRGFDGLRPWLLKAGSRAVGDV